MNYMICIPTAQMVSRENCERIHNILARMSDTYKIEIRPEQVKIKQGTAPDFYRKYRIYKEIRDRDGNAEAYLAPDEEEMILSVCRNEEEISLMKNCTYAYQYPASVVLKSFRDDKKEKTYRKEPLKEGTEAPAEEFSREGSENIKDRKRNRELKKERNRDRERPDRAERTDRERPDRTERTDRERRDRVDRADREHQERPDRDRQEEGRRDRGQHRDRSRDRVAKEENPCAQRQGRPQNKNREERTHERPF